MSGEIIGLHQWFGSAPGRYLLDWEQARYDELVADVFGFHALQLGLPALQGLPSIALGPATDDAIGSDPAQQAALEAQAWALQRWRATRVDVVLAGVDDARADAWEQALRSVLSARGIAIGEVERRRGGEPMVELRLPAP